MTANQESSVSVSTAFSRQPQGYRTLGLFLVGDGPQNKPIPPSCSGNINAAGNVCLIISGGAVEIWSNDQISAAQAKFQATKQISNVDGALTAIRAIFGERAQVSRMQAGQLAKPTRRSLWETRAGPTATTAVPRALPELT